MNCEKCQNRLSQQQQKAIQEYNFYCEKFCIPKNKFFLTLLEKKYLYFDISNYSFLLNDDHSKISSIFATYSYWTSLSITSTSYYMSDNIKIRILNFILSFLKPNLITFNTIHSISLSNLPLISTKTLSLLYNIFLNNKGLIHINIQNCSFIYANIDISNSPHLKINPRRNVLSISSPLHINTHKCSLSHNYKTCANIYKSNNIKHKHGCKGSKSLNTMSGFYTNKSKGIGNVSGNSNINRTNNNNRNESIAKLNYRYSFKSILQGIYSHPSIQTISLINNNIPDHDSNYLINMLMNQTNKQKTKNWSHTLHSNYTLSSLPLKYTLNSLYYINLSHNKLSNIFAKEMSHLIESDIYLRKVDLSYNNFQYKDCYLLCKSIKLNRFIVNLNLNGNPGLEEKIYIKLIMHLGKNIKYLKYCWDIGEYTENEFKQIIVNNVDKDMFQIDINVNGLLQNEGRNDENGYIEEEREENEGNEQSDKMLKYEEAIEKIKELEKENKMLRNTINYNSKYTNKKRTKSVGFF